MMNNEKKEFTAPLMLTNVFDHKDYYTTSGKTWEIGKIDLIPDLNSDSSS